jgi:hypothetical protein
VRWRVEAEKARRTSVRSRARPIAQPAHSATSQQRLVGEEETDGFQNRRPGPATDHHRGASRRPERRGHRRGTGSDQRLGGVDDDIDTPRDDNLGVVVAVRIVVAVRVVVTVRGIEFGAG